MKNSMVNTFLFVVFSTSLYAQQPLTESQRMEISALIDKYSQAREKQDTVLLKSILTFDIDQLVSTGEWREGVNAAVKGMLRSSATNSGTRRLSIHKIRMIDPQSAIIDCRYEISGTEGALARNMWSTFVVIHQKKTWKITAIRNMLPSQ